MSKRKIYVVGGGKSVANWMEGDVVDSMDEATMVVLPGGADTNPALYGKKRHPKTFYYEKVDALEYPQMRRAIEKGLPIVGICRGAQLLCVQAGGILIQHQEGQGPVHPIRTLDSKKILVSSLHHQAQYPYPISPTDYLVLGWAEGLCDSHEGEDSAEEMVHGVIDGSPEIEICYYRKIKGLAIQGHPEMIYGYSADWVRRSIAYHRHLVDQLEKGLL